MVSYPVQNLSEFLKNKPPVVIFLICLVALAVSTFYYTFQMENDGSVVNSDKQHDWLEMIKQFNKLDICINTSSWDNEIHILEDKQSFTHEVSVLTQVSVKNSNILKSWSKVGGFLSLEGWLSISCQDEGKQPKSVEVFFDVPPLPSISNNSVDICVTIKGPAEYLPYFSKPLCAPRKSIANTHQRPTGFLTSKLSKVYEPSFCEKGNITKMVFESTKTPIENYLSDDVKTQIYIHLVWCSYFLVFVTFSVLLYAILKKSEYWEKKEQSARLL